jgi:hypothetical protein
MTTLSRHNVVTSAVALPAALAVPVVASASDDPTHAKIATARAAWAACAAVATNELPIAATYEADIEVYARWEEVKKTKLQRSLNSHSTPRWLPRRRRAREQPS